MFVVDRERKHTTKVFKAFLAILVEKREDDFGVGVGGEGVALFEELRAFFLEVVYFTVKNNFVAIKIPHWLVSEGREIDDGEAAMSQANFFVGREICAAIIGTAMPDGVGHGFDFFGRDFFVGERNFSGDTAHRRGKPKIKREA